MTFSHIHDFVNELTDAEKSLVMILIHNNPPKDQDSVELLAQRYLSLTQTEAKRLRARIRELTNEVLPS